MALLSNYYMSNSQHGQYTTIICATTGYYIKYDSLCPNCSRVPVPIQNAAATKNMIFREYPIKNNQIMIGNDLTIIDHHNLIMTNGGDSS